MSEGMSNRAARQQTNKDGARRIFKVVQNRPEVWCTPARKLGALLFFRAICHSDLDGCGVARLSFLVED